ncbi:DNA-directed RNA polymerase M, 15kDa subunit, conserved site,Pol I subunit A12, C-terminal zinc [Cinara cedri]|uniref:DNA-directed RNA polymerase subunit n=1 Tax=Cinara cedri TaxID=506608 RepID=A0A5E4MKT9_9HEMI|nr:DNA-directed RNA polymerase M, 15kDa subunit, conserved site,Pol I subunit A12, C-terminal zinc [Cinara cedri]
MELSKDIETYPGFCTKCGSILPSLSTEEFVKCYSCKTVFGPEIYGNSEAMYDIVLNSVEDLDNVVKAGHNKDKTEDGPIAERRCSACGHNQMSYAAVQLRSADEGQTVFYTCIKCKFTEAENS